MPRGDLRRLYGWKSPGRLHNCQSPVRRMMNLKGNS